MVPSGSRTDLLLERHRYVGDGMRADLRLRDLPRSPVHVELVLDLAADLADAFAVEDGRAGAAADVETSAANGAGLRTGVLVQGDGGA
ncbi:hypothetical protein NUM3379_28030 [Kineococcus sp. NUM-3379]